MGVWSWRKEKSRFRGQFLESLKICSWGFPFFKRLQRHQTRFPRVPCNRDCLPSLFAWRFGFAPVTACNSRHAAGRGGISGPGSRVEDVRTAFASEANRALNNEKKKNNNYHGGSSSSRTGWIVWAASCPWQNINQTFARKRRQCQEAFWKTVHCFEPMC